MSGTKEGAIKGKKKILARDPNFYKKIGAKGGSAENRYPKGFAAATYQQRVEWGKKGGKISRRSKMVK